MESVLNPDYVNVLKYLGIKNISVVFERRYSVAKKEQATTETFGS